MLVRCEKPRELAHIAKVSTRRWEQYENHCQRENPILEGLRFLRVFEQESVSTYAQAADILGVSRPPFCQLTSLVTRLPQQIKDFLVDNEDPAVLRHFTERRLRPLTGLATDQQKLDRFWKMLAEARPAAAHPSGFSDPPHSSAVPARAQARARNRIL